MSYIKRPQTKETDQHFLLQIVPNPSVTVNATQQLAQKDVINQIREAGADLFQPNHAVEVGANTKVKTKSWYNRNVSIDDLTAAMDKYKLVMQVNLKGDNGISAMATADDLRNNRSISSATGAFSLVRHGSYIRGIDVI